VVLNHADGIRMVCLAHASAYVEHAMSKVVPLWQNENFLSVKREPVRRLKRRAKVIRIDRYRRKRGIWKR
jgi:hypothetical protein